MGNLAHWKEGQPSGGGMKIFRSEKGISPVLSALLMMAVAIGAAIVTNVWIITYLDTTMTKVKRNMWIPSVHFTNGNGATYTAITIYVQNVKDGSIQLTQVYVNNAMVSEDEVTMSNAGFIEEGKTCTINVTNQSFMKNDEIRIKIASFDGKFTEGVFEV